METLTDRHVSTLLERFRTVRRKTLDLCAPLSPEDMMVQSCPEASPVKWHLAHSAWFFESFILREFLPDYELFDPDFPWLFNSYYQTFAEFPDKRLRSSFSRPPLERVLEYRLHVDAAMERLLEAGAPEEALYRMELGINHEEQHQELMLTDIQHAFYTNPLQPDYLDDDSTLLNSMAAIALPGATMQEIAPMKFFQYEGGLVEIGQADPQGGQTSGFSFDNERPRHRVWIEPFRLASRLVTCGEYAEFIADRGYERPELWLSAGWQTVESQSWQAPLYWRKLGPGEPWTIGTLRGKRRLAEAANCPVAHVSFFEADAYARWKGLRLATEAEWESVAQSLPVSGNFLESGKLRPLAAGYVNGHVSQIFGDCWEWTSSAYLGYPGFTALPGSLGEYNGKFMSGQMVLRGGSCVTPQSHIRATYRNFFPPETRWQLSGIRLASS